MPVPRKLKHNEVSKARDLLLKTQNGVCPLCTSRMGAKGKKPALDHDHKTGYIRDVLCINCNGMEGKLFGIARRGKSGLSEVEWLKNVLAYYDRHSTPRHGGIWHPTHKTDAEKRLAVNKKARLKRAKLKAAK